MTANIKTSVFLDRANFIFKQHFRIESYSLVKTVYSWSLICLIRSILLIKSSFSMHKSSSGLKKSSNLFSAMLLKLGLPLFFLSERSMFPRVGGLLLKVRFRTELKSIWGGVMLMWGMAGSPCLLNSLDSSVFPALLEIYQHDLKARPADKYPECASL